MATTLTGEVIEQMKHWVSIGSDDEAVQGQRLSYFLCDDPALMMLPEGTKLKIIVEVVQ